MSLTALSQDLSTVDRKIKESFVEAIYELERCHSNLDSSYKKTHLLTSSLEASKKQTNLCQQISLEKGSIIKKKDEIIANNDQEIKKLKKRVRQQRFQKRISQSLVIVVTLIAIL